MAPAIANTRNQGSRRRVRGNISDTRKNGAAVVRGSETSVAAKVSCPREDRNRMGKRPMSAGGSDQSRPSTAARWRGVATASRRLTPALRAFGASRASRARWTPVRLLRASRPFALPFTARGWECLISQDAPRGGPLDRRHGGSLGTQL